MRGGLAVQFRVGRSIPSPPIQILIKFFFLQTAQAKWPYRLGFQPPRFLFLPEQVKPIVFIFFFGFWVLFWLSILICFVLGSVISFLLLVFIYAVQLYMIWCIFCCRIFIKIKSFVTINLTTLQKNPQFSMNEREVLC